MLTFTVGDALKSQSRLRLACVGVGLKDRSAILMGGRRADAAYWFENDGGNFVTSTYYMNAAPEWLNEWNRQPPRRPFRKADLEPPDRRRRVVREIRRQRCGRRRARSEGHHVPASVCQPRRPRLLHYVELRRSPFADEVVLDFALEVMKQPRARKGRRHRCPGDRICGDRWHRSPVGARQSRTDGSDAAAGQRPRPPVRAG